jgi:hypothetical protein
MWLFAKKYPVPGKDAHWAAFCPKCKDLTSWASRGGFKPGGTEHCYDCGFERETKGFSQEDIDRMVLSSKYHWMKYPLIPYNWHELTEDGKWRILKINA